MQVNTMSERTTLARLGDGDVKALGWTVWIAVYCSSNWGSTSALDDPDAAIPSGSMTRLWHERGAVRQSAIGLNMSKVYAASFHVAGYALMSSRTLAEGFQRLVRSSTDNRPKARLELSVFCRRLCADSDCAWRSSAADPAKCRGSLACAWHYVSG